MPFLFSLDPPNTIWISSFGSVLFGKGVHLQCGITDFKLLPISVQALHSLAFANISRWIFGHQTFCASDSIAKLPGRVEWTSSSTASWIAFGIAIRSSRQMHLSFTLKSHQWEKMYGLIYFNLSGSFRSTQSRTSFKIASFPVSIDRSFFLLKTLLRVTVKRKSPAASSKLPDGIVSVLDEVFVAGVEGVVSEKVTRALLGVALFVFDRGVLVIELT